MSSVPSDPLPGPSRGASETPVNSVYLVKDYQTQVSALLAEQFIDGAESPPLELLQILSEFMEVKMGGDRSLPPAGSSLPFDDIANYVENLKTRGDRSSLLTLDVRKEQTVGEKLYFGVVLDQDFVDKLSTLLRSPSLKIRGEVELPVRHENSSVVYMEDADDQHWGRMGMEGLREVDADVARLLLMNEVLVLGWDQRRRSPQKFQLDKIIQLKSGMRLDHCVSGWIPTERLVQFNPNLEISIMLSVQLSWEHVPEPDVWAAVKLSTESFLQALYKDETGLKDVTIAVGNGAEVQCHRFILSAHSPVLATMLSPKNGMREGQTGRMEWKENSEEGVGYLLRYLYGMHLTTEEMDCEVAVELLKTAHRYELQQLERCLRELLLRKGGEWYGPDDLLELYFFAGVVDRFWKLRDHVFNIMKGMPIAIRSSDGFKELGQDEARHLECKLFGYWISPAE